MEIFKGIDYQTQKDFNEIVTPLGYKSENFFVLGNEGITKMIMETVINKSMRRHPELDEDEILFANVRKNIATDDAERSKNAFPAYEDLLKYKSIRRLPHAINAEGRTMADNDVIFVKRAEFIEQVLAYASSENEKARTN